MATNLAGNKSIGWFNDRANGVGNIVHGGQVSGVINDGRIMEILTATDVDAQNNTLSVAQIKAGILVHTSTTGGGTVTTDTAANIIAGVPLTTNGQAVTCYYINDGSQTLTFAGGTDVTIADTGSTVLTNEAAIIVFFRTAATTVTAYIMH